MPPKTVKFAFRGLMVLNYQQDAMGKKYMEIGFLDARSTSASGNPHMGHTAVDSPVHVPRILKMENGLLAEVIDLRNRRELGLVRNWELEVTNHLQAEVTLSQTGNFDRKKEPTTAEEKRDFRWITDLEAADMHNQNLTSQIATGNLLMVLTVRHGEFSTKMQSPRFTRKTLGTGQLTDYGFAAAVTGCDITFDSDAGGGVRLMAVGGTRLLVTEFDPKDDGDTIFEISNSPPDVPADAPIPAGEGGHFHMYYDKLFIQPPSEQFDFVAVGLAPAPDPALCGATFLGQRNDPL